MSWETDHQATAFGQLPFFIEFLEMTGLFNNWVADSPLSYSSPNAPHVRDVLGTWMLSILSGHKRYAHVTNIRSDAVNPNLLNMSKVVSEDSLRRGLAKMTETGHADSWLKQHLKHSTNDLLDNPWILDVDTSVKPIYGKQEGAVVSYNPTKRGRPSQCYHTYLIANQRLVLGVELMAGNEHASKHDIAPLSCILDELSTDKRPHLVRGDSGFGNDPMMRMLEDTEQPYLFKLRQTSNVKKLISRLFYQNNWTNIPNTDWQAIDSNIKLSGWERSRRVAVFRREVKDSVVVVHDDNDKQQVLGFTDTRKSAIKGYEYAVLVTNSSFSLNQLLWLYRDRADAENVFDELKNHWGWGGFTTQDLGRCQLSAQAVALIYNWWTLYVRMLSPDKHHEAITSKPLLMHGIGRQTKHANKTKITIATTHAKTDKARSWLITMSNRLKQYQTNAEQLKISIFAQCCDFIKQHFKPDKLSILATQ